MTRRVLAALVALLALAGSPGLVRAQAPAAAKPASTDTPFVKVGGTIFVDYTYQQSPTILDSDSNRVHLGQFNVARAYINVTGNVSHLLAFRITPDVARETGTGASLAGSLNLRLKYAYAQLNLGDWLSSGSWIRLGIQQTPWVDFEESVYRYRFQGPVFTDREGFLSSADAGASLRLALPAGFGDVHAGVYNGETYSRAETNNQKAFQVRGTLRPFARMTSLLNGISTSVFYDGDNYVRDGDRDRLIASAMFEHPIVNAGFQYLAAADRPSASDARTKARGYSAWLTPRSAIGLEALLRYDRLKPDAALDEQRKTRVITGVSYWLPHVGNAVSAFMLDYEVVRFENYPTAQPTQKRITLHGLVNF